ncbi:MAG: GNAT family N-acetyltransferase [Candidatus Caenarcaniphilales bacterium]|nr:GNAT family N-acetyltransferase [Candidatus Caenarcaniphilales bacterium]
MYHCNWKNCDCDGLDLSELIDIPYPIELDKALNLPKDNEGRINLSNHYLYGAAFSQKADLSNYNLRNANLESTILDDIILPPQHVQGASFRKASFENKDLSDFDLEGCDLSSSELNGAKLPKSIENVKSIKYADFNWEDLVKNQEYLNNFLVDILAYSKIRTQSSSEDELESMGVLKFDWAKALEENYDPQVLLDLLTKAKDADLNISKPIIKSFDGVSAESLRSLLKKITLESETNTESLRASVPILKVFGDLLHQGHERVKDKLAQDVFKTKIEKELGSEESQKFFKMLVREDHNLQRSQNFKILEAGFKDRTNKNLIDLFEYGLINFDDEEFKKLKSIILALNDTENITVQGQKIDNSFNETMYGDLAEKLNFDSPKSIDPTIKTESDKFRTILKEVKVKLEQDIKSQNKLLNYFFSEEERSTLIHEVKNKFSEENIRNIIETIINSKENQNETTIDRIAVKGSVVNYLYKQLKPGTKSKESNHLKPEEKLAEIQKLIKDESVIEQLVQRRALKKLNTKLNTINATELNKIFQKIPQLAPRKSKLYHKQLLNKLEKQSKEIIIEANKQFIDKFCTRLNLSNSSNEIKTIKEKSLEILNGEKGQRQDDFLLNLRYLTNTLNAFFKDPEHPNITVGKKITTDYILEKDYTETNQWLLNNQKDWVNMMKAIHPNFKIENLVKTEHKTPTFEYTDPKSGYRFVVEPNRRNFIKQSEDLNIFSCLNVDEFHSHYLFGNIANINISLVWVYDDQGNLSHRQLFTTDTAGVAAKPSYRVTKSVLPKEASQNFLKAFSEYLGLNISDKTAIVDQKQQIPIPNPSFPDSAVAHDSAIFCYPTTPKAKNSAINKSPILDDKNYQISSYNSGNNITAQELEDIVNLHNQNLQTQTSIQEKNYLYRSNNSPILITVKHQGEIIAFLDSYKSNDKERILSSIAVNPKFRKKGIASEMFTSLEKEMKKNDPTTKKLKLQFRSLELVDFYSKLGFSKLFQEGNYSNGDPMHHISKSIDISS